MEDSERLIRLMTVAERMRLAKRLWREMTEGDSYQPYGYDSRTMRICHPQRYRLYERLMRYYK